jgi:hypothetical protein
MGLRCAQLQRGDSLELECSTWAVSALYFSCRAIACVLDFAFLILLRGAGGALLCC